MFGFCRALVIVCVLGLPAAGSTLAWFSTPQATNFDSTGAPMNSGFQFQVGVFKNGFQPTALNTAQWLTHWQAAATVNYAETSKRFDGIFTVDNNLAPFSSGAQGWVFGRRDTVTGSEWILFRSTSWTWPSPNPMSPFTIDWSAAQATTVVLGQINPSGSPFLMRSAAVTSWDQWRAAQLAGQSLDGPSDDPDGDGVTNLLEYAFGSSPTQPGPAPLTPATLVWVDGKRYLQISVPRRSDRQVTWVVEVSGDLVQWHSGPAVTQVVTQTPDALVVRDLVAYEPPTTRRFMRVRASLPVP